MFWSYVHAMSPTMWHEQYSEYLPLPDVYSYVMKQLDEENYEGEQKGKAKKLRDEVIGSTWMKSAPDLYWDVGMLIDLGVRPVEWRNPQIWGQTDRAKVRAHRFVENMSSTVQRYNDYVKSQKEKMRKGTGGKGS